MAAYQYRTRGVCARELSFDLEDGKLHNVAFIGGCNGNLKAIGRLVEGADAVSIMKVLRGNECGGKGTSCADQLSRAIEEALKENGQTL